MSQSYRLRSWMREHRTMTIKLEALHGQVMDALGYDFFSFSRYPEVFGEPGRRYFEVLAEQFHGWQRKIYDSHPPDTMEITPESVWTKKGPTAPSAIDLRRRPAVLDAMGIHPANTLDEVVALDAASRRTAERLTAARAA